ncbi:MAG: 3-oxoadipyl-CoA thiolase [Ignavibacteriae bacterium HGW-Ignavibacteriae-1]|jgi:3-oxoadipyl-CoA thiolase|nr:MAG: 3-oxoadipyl-CoA thiolase [Ignavibacteriae bacterium HGW-Ignavibacteriae-1]
MKTAYICDAIRTPIGKHGGTLASVRPDDMAALTIRELIKRNPQIDPALIDDVILGNANQAGEDNRDVARMALLLAGLPWSVPGETVNRLCASGMSAVIQASRAIAAGDGDLFIAGGVESMTRAPFVMSKADAAYSRNVQIYDTSIGWRFVNPKMKEMYGTDSMGETAENVAELWKISRYDQDEFAFNSQMKAVAARNSGRLAKEIVGVEIVGKKSSTTFAEDEFIRDETTVETLSKLKPAFKAVGSVTAGNASGINDGACALIIASPNGISNNKITPLSRIVASAVVGVEPRIMGVGPVEAANKALKKAGLTFDDMDVIELNEAFAAQSLACLNEWGIAATDSRLNPNGGAIALGHPLGMTGARLLTTATYELIERNAKYALCTMCVGVGQGYAVIIERV